ncbi:PadR family transcriptional regulator [Mesopusillimonas faecipullorum]|nr:PadR family transcriptional regulator [Mesopusillimonas faecipullorum]
MHFRLPFPPRPHTLSILPESAFAGDEGRHLMRGRKVGAEDLQLMLLALLEKQGSHGYDLIKALDELSNGYYKPSPGVVYPALGHLETSGWVACSREGAKKRYELTTAGTEHLRTQHTRAQLLFKRLQHASKRMAWLRQAMDGQPRELGPEGEDLATGWLPELVDMRRALRMALMKHTDATPATQRRLIAILQQTVKSIAALDENPGGSTSPATKE